MGCLLAVNSLAVYLPVRVTSALLGTATAWVVGRLAAELAPERPAAAPWATALYAVNYLVGRDGHFAVSDALLCFEISLALLCCARAVARDPRWLAAAAFFAGTAFATKYSAIGLLFPCAAAAVESPGARRRARAERRPSPWPPDWPASCWWRRTSRPTGRRFVPVWSVISAATTPLEPRPGQSSTRSRCFRRRSAGSGSWSASGAWSSACGPAAASSWPSTSSCSTPASSAPCTRSSSATRGSPLVPALAAAGGVACASGCGERLAVRWPRALATAAIALAVLGPPVVRLIAFDSLLGRDDTRISRGTGWSLRVPTRSS